MDPAWEWHVGDPIGTGNDIGAPEVPYMNYGPKARENEEEEFEYEENHDQSRSKSNQLSDEAWKLYQEGRYNEALLFINRALEYCEDVSNTLNRKAIILNDLKRYEDALIYYDKAIAIESSDVYSHNKATCLIDYCNQLKDGGNIELGMSNINEALKIFQNINDKRYEDEAWNLKGIFLERSGDIPEAFSCYKKALELAENDNTMKQTYKENRDRLLALIDNSDLTCPKCGNTLKVTDNFCLKCGTHVEIGQSSLKENNVERIRWSGRDNSGASIIEIDEDDYDSDAEKLMRFGRENLITIAGSSFYANEDKFFEGAKLLLLREPHNAYDSDAIAVYLDGYRVGYVSNSDSTNSSLTTKASEIKGISDVGNGEYLMKYDGIYHIARVIR